MTVNTINTCAATLYAIMDSNGCLLTIKNRTLHSTRADARKYRKLTNRENVRIVKGDFTNYTEWTTAK
tara:strand:+ start:84 stop:287 length:204 start_codon:yes stop_codon:yes gene_type:complete